MHAGLFFLVIYAVANIVGLVGGIMWASSTMEENGWHLLVFPKIWETARESWRLSKVGAAIACILIGIFFLPSVILTLAFYFILFLIIGFCSLFCLVFKRKD